MNLLDGSVSPYGLKTVPVVLDSRTAVAALCSVANRTTAFFAEVMVTATLHIRKRRMTSGDAASDAELADGGERSRRRGDSRVRPIGR